MGEGGFKVQPKPICYFFLLGFQDVEKGDHSGYLIGGHNNWTLTLCKMIYSKHCILQQ